MKQTIITILLAVVAMTGQAQVKSGLDLCLRDEATGEWLIGLFDEYARTAHGSAIEEECHYYRRGKA